ncbi:nucleotide exchange factor GrpE [Candidatus Saccharibacteria bacterium]|nr:nucleotide exchange factor GrpE [Candidatus Saccharibacteria bacterium]
MKEKKVQEDNRIVELTNDLQRTRADFENFRKQVENQKENERKAAKLATVFKMLPLLDDMDRAILSYEELKPLEKTLIKTLNDLGLEKIDSSEGVEFNPDLFDAVMVEGEGEKEVVSETLRPGYYYEKEVLRPAMVKVKKV